ncbi:MAG: FAD:protein FMN transferase [Fimbriiglobus sp.]
MRIWTALAALLGCCMIAAASDDPPARYEFESKHMGTLFRIVLYAADRPAAEAAAKAAFARVAELDAVMSDYNTKSELMLLCTANDAAPGKPRPVSGDLFAVLEQAHATAAASGGAFDYTVGPLSRLWRLARRTQQLPDAQELAGAKAKVGYRHVTLDSAAKTVTLAVPGMRLDLGGIGKGFAADAALAVLRQRGVTQALVAASGDITTADAPPGKAGWSVDIAPIAAGRPARRLTLANAAVSTSGDLFQFVEIGGVRYSHVLDPATGLGLTGRRSATVIAPTGAQADSLTKAASVLLTAKALALIDGVPGAAMSVVAKESDEGVESTTASKRFAAFLDGKP